ncbi:RNA helicase required for poly(A+) mRNA export [Aspergillus fumigatus]|nr:RNA helicase required for poly(A+) mRNA export [Aspergillus fumigatus]
MASEQPVEAAPTGGSLADRITKPDESNTSETPAPIGDQTDGAPAQLGGSDLHEPEYNVEVKLSDLQADPNNPLYSVKNFEDLGLDPRILKGLSSMNFRKPSKIQERALPLLLNNPPKNLVGQSQSGTGKTAAFVLNALSRVDLSTEQMQKTPQALILAPTRELARQILGVVQVMGQFVDGLIIGAAVPTDRDSRPKRLECSIVVGTPGTVGDMIKRRTFIPNKLKVLVLDEADNMLDQQGLGDQCIRVKALLPRDIQVVLFSATFPEHVHQYASKFAPNANEITLQHEELTVEGIKQLYLDCADGEDKYRTLVQLYGLLTVGSSIIFVQTRAAARGEAKVLIATNVLARGIDVSTVSMVINYDIPELHQPNVPGRQADFQTYLHRIGRTGRFGRVGVSISFVSNREEWEMLNQIQTYFNCEIQRVDTKDWDEVEDIIKKTIKNSRANPKFAGGKD